MEQGKPLIAWPRDPMVVESSSVYALLGLGTQRHPNRLRAAECALGAGTKTLGLAIELHTYLQEVNSMACKLYHFF